MSTTPPGPAGLPASGPTGTRVWRDGQSYLVLKRTFRAPVDAVWAAVTDAERMARWIGTWTGDPRTGGVSFRMLFEGEDAPDEPVEIDECRPPNRLATRHKIPGDDFEWRIELDLSEQSGLTTLTFTQAMVDPEIAENVGPGWDYYLDRLVAVESGADPNRLVWGDYYPTHADYYQTLFSPSDPAVTARAT